MKQSRARYIAFSLLALFIFTFSFQNVSAATRNFRIEISTLFNGKYLKSIHTPSDQNNAADENPFETETEDETETEFNPALPVMSFAQNLSFNFHHEKTFVKPTDKESSQDTQHPLYLVIRTFKI